MKIVIDIPARIYKMARTNHLNIIDSDILEEAVTDGTPLPKCKDCKHFEYDSVAKVDGIPLIVAHEICKRWGDGCKTSEDGYCFLFEAKEGDAE